MRWDLDKVETPIAYKLLAATVMPRPIAWVVSQSAAGEINAAPYSFFNVVGSAPPSIVLGILPDPARGMKDSARNILETGDFTVNLVPERLAEAMNVTSIDAPKGVNELELARLETAPSTHIAPPRIAASPVNFECRALQVVETGPNQAVVIAQVLAIHVADDFVIDGPRAHIDTPALDLVGRSFATYYVRTKDTFSLTRPTWAEHIASKTE
jgi:flavin reductase (DIM6/NTAB) family NADH-FMN oxidoreductase RutF